MGRQAGSTLTERVMTRLRREITTARIPPGKVLPSEAELCRRFGVSRVTVRRVLDRLKDEELVESRAGIGHFAVRRPVAAKPPGLDGRTEILYVHDVGQADDVFGAVGAGVYAGVVEEASRLGMDVFQVCVTPERIRTLIAERARSTLAGVLFDWNDRALAQFMVDSDVPFVVVEGDFDDLQVAAVVQDDTGGTLAALEHLYAGGRRRLAYLGLDDSWIHRRRRESAFRTFHLRHGLALPEERLAFAAFAARPDGRPEATRLLALDPRPDAVFIANRELLDAFLAAAGAAGLDVPGDLNVVVWGEPSPGDRHAALDHIAWNRREMGQLSVRVLIDRATRRETGRMQVLIPSHLRVFA